MPSIPRAFYIPETTLKKLQSLAGKGRSSASVFRETLKSAKSVSLVPKLDGKMVRTAFRLDDDELAKINQITEATGLSQSKVVTLLIENTWQANQGENQ